MIESDIEIPEDINAEILIVAIERACRAHDLHCTLKGSLRKYPGSVHWHFKKAKERGTLELTWWEDKQRLWFKVAESRTGAWVGESMLQIKEEIQNLLD